MVSNGVLRASTVAVKIEGGCAPVLRGLFSTSAMPCWSVRSGPNLSSDAACDEIPATAHGTSDGQLAEARLFTEHRNRLAHVDFLLVVTRPRSASIVTSVWIESGAVDYQRRVALLHGLSQRDFPKGAAHSHETKLRPRANKPSGRNVHKLAIEMRAADVNRPYQCPGNPAPSLKR